MRVHRTPRYQGKITSWKDEQGFGFITPNGGGPAVFVHVKAFSGHGTRPGAGQIVTYELTFNDKGQPRAANVALLGAGSPRPAGAPLPAAAPRRSGALVAAAGFFMLMGIAVVAGKVPPLLLASYAGLSALTFLVYAADKSAAQNDRWRTKESTLHLFAALGGWPGALVAQQILRHKSKKASFRNAFRVTVVVNCCALGWLLSTSGYGVLQLFSPA